ncbi:hypothetical protein LT493_02585, partial [Streptomyces tricolor]|nr:hypothetical protein [Streptomyces tricolor]
MIETPSPPRSGDRHGHRGHRGDPVHHYWPPAPDEEPRQDVAEYISMMVGGALRPRPRSVEWCPYGRPGSGAVGHVQAEASAAPPDPAAVAGLRRRWRGNAPGAQSRRVRTPCRRPLSGPAMAAGAAAGPARLAHPARTDLRAAGPDPRRRHRDPVRAATLQETLAQLSTLDDARRGREADARATPCLPCCGSGFDRRKRPAFTVDLHVHVRDGAHLPRGDG